MTVGYNPYRTLARFFHSKAEPSIDEIAEARLYIEQCFERDATPSELFDRFLELSQKHSPNGATILDALANAGKGMVGGLLESISPFHARPVVMDPKNLKWGVYDHFKGGVYQIRDFSSWGSGKGELVVEYISLIFATKHTKLADEWCEVVQWPDGKYRGRYVWRSTDSTGPEPSFKVPSPKVDPSTLTPKPSDSSV